MSILGPLAGSEPRTDRLVEAEDSPDAVWTFLPLAREGDASAGPGDPASGSRERAIGSARCCSPMSTQRSVVCASAWPMAS
jgi:hypothetical protein